MAKSKRKTVALQTGISDEAEREFQRVLAVANKYAPELFKIPGVISVGVGRKRKAYKLDSDDLVVVIAVRRKLNSRAEKTRLKKANTFIPETLDGVPTDVIENIPGRHAGGSQPIPPRGDTFDVVQGGIVTQSSSLLGEVGTLGGCLYIKKHPGGKMEANGLGGKGVAMSNSHVWAGPWVSTTGNTRVYQSTLRDGDDIGAVVASSPDQDAAICLLGYKTGQVDFTTEIFGLGQSPAGFGIPRPNQRVVKSGAFTGVTNGKVDSVLTASTGRIYWQVSSDSGFSFSGDSGSFVINEDNQLMVGLLWGGDNGWLSAFESAENIARELPFLTFDKP